MSTKKGSIYRSLCCLESTSLAGLSRGSVSETGTVRESCGFSVCFLSQIGVRFRGGVSADALYGSVPEPHAEGSRMGTAEGIVQILSKNPSNIKYCVSFLSF